MGKFAQIPLNLIPRMLELSPPAMVLYTYYLCKFNPKHPNPISKATVLREMPTFPERAYYRGKAELRFQGWIDGEEDDIFPNIVPPPHKEKPKPTSDKSVRAKKTPPLTNLSGNSDKSVTKEPVCSDKSVTNPDKSVRDILRNTYTDLLIPDKEHTAELAGGKTPDSSDPNKNNGQKSPDDPSPDMQAVFDRWREVTNSKRAKFTDDRKKKIRARLENDGFTVEELFQCLDGWKLSQWHQGQNPSATVYDKVETIFRNGEQVEKFIKLVARPEITWVDPDGGEVKANPMTFADVMSMDFAVYRPDGDPREMFDNAKRNYLARHKGEQFEAEVTAYEHSDEFRERLEKARP